MPAAMEDQGEILSTSLELLRLARAGDRAALDALFERLFPPLRQWAHGRLPKWSRGVADTTDVVQEVLLNTFRHLGTVEVRRTGALQHYLRQAVRNRVVDELRAFSRHGSPTPVDSAIADRRPSPLELAMDAELRKRYLAALSRLRAADQELIVGRLDLGYNYEQLALASGRLSAEAARVAVRRATQRLITEMGR